MTIDDEAQKAAESQTVFLSAQAAAPISVAYSSTVGVVMVLSTVFIAAINVTVIQTLLNVKELYRLSSYKFIIGIGVSSVFQMSAEFSAGILTIFRTNGPASFNRLISATIVSGYSFYLLLTVVLALNRLIIVISPSTEHLLFGKFAVKVWFAVCTVIAVAFFFCLLSPWMGVFYDWHILSFDYLYALPRSYIFQYYKCMIERWGSYAVTCIYLVNFVFIRAKRKQNSDSKKQRRNSSTVDGKLLIQSFAITADCLILNVFWYYCKDFLPMVFSSAVGSLSFLNFLWIFSCAVNPIVYFLLNK